jgi:hypothetical protein
VANEAIPYKRPGEDVTGYCTAAVIGKRCVQISGPKTNEKGEGLASVTTGGGAYRVSLPSGAGANGGAAKIVFGVAKYDAAINKWVGILREGIVPITTSAAISAGQPVQVAADGTVIVWTTGVQIGIACDDAASGADAEIALTIS